MLYIIIAIALVVLVAFIASKPDEFKVSRSILMNAPAEKIFLHVNNLQKWGAWSPWVKMDPQAKIAFNGPASGVNASSSWEGTKAGTGTMTIIESRVHDLIRLRLDFVKPMQATNMAEFTFVPEAGQTLVTWSMEGKNSFIGKAMSLMMNCDKMVGDQFTNGLTSLKQIAESQN